ncbi:hypothetical protein [Rhodobacter sp. NSM]|uniref:hypothetical protein n=1 Tax=Rhodobacter sp. NSM TaxID=3457501 RepID=UPI003FD4BB37
MNMRPDAFGDIGALACDSRPSTLDEVRIVPLTGSLAALFFDRPRPVTKRPRLATTIDGGPAPLPSMSTSVPLEQGGLRHMLLLQIGTPQLLASRIVMTLDGRPEAEASPDWLQPPLRSLPALLAGLGPAGRAQVLKTLLTTGASLFAASAGDGMTLLARQILELCSVMPASPIGAAAFGTGHALLSYDLPAPSAPDAPVVALAGGLLHRLTDSAAFSDGKQLHLHLSRRLPADSELVILGPEPIRLALHEEAAQPLATWLDGRSEDLRQWALGRVRAAAPRDEMAQALLQEMRTADLPVHLRTLTLAATSEGLLHACRLEDPERLVRAIRIDRGGRFADILPSPDPDGTSLMAGHVALPPADDDEGPCRIQIVLGSGRLRTVATLTPACWSGDVPVGFAEAWNDWRLTQNPALPDPALAIALARRSIPPQRIPVRVRSYGPDRLGRISLISPVGPCPDLITVRAAVIAGEEQAQSIDVILTAPEGPQAALARERAAAASEIYAIPHRIVTHPASANTVEVLRAAAALAAGPVLMLGPSVLPTTEGWLEEMLRHLSTSGALVTALALLDREGAIVGGPAFLAEGRIVRPMEGLPAARLAPVSGTQVVSADCAVLSRAGVERMLASPVGHSEPALALGELARVDRTAGRASPFLATHPFQRFGGPAPAEGVAEAALVHGLRLLDADLAQPEAA